MRAGLDPEPPPPEPTQLRSLLQRERRRREHAELAERRARMLADASRLLADYPGQEATLTGITRMAAAELADCCSIHLAEGGHLATIAYAHAGEAGSTGYAPRPQLPRALSQTMAMTLRSGAPERFTPAAPAPGEPTDVLCIPIAARGRVLGLLSLCRFGSGSRFRAGDEQIAAELAVHVALALNNAQLYREAEMARVRTERIQAVTAALSEAADTHEIADAVLRHAGVLEGSHSGMLALLSEDGGWLHRVYPTGYQPDVLHPWDRFPVAPDTPLGDAARRRRLVALPNRNAVVARYPAVRETMVAAETEALVALPLVVHGTLVGAMGLGFPTPRAFTVEDRAFLAMVGQLCAQALARGRLMEQEHAARGRAEAAVSARDEVLRVVAHDLGNPLSGVLTTSAALVRAGADAAAREAAQNIHRAAQHMQRLRRDLLDVAMIDAGQLSLVRAPVAPGELAEDAVAQLRPLAAERDISLAVRAAPGLPPVDADRDRILQVLTNLVGNAIKFSPDGAVVECGAEADGETVCFSVRDQGAGVPEAHRAQVFDRFWRSGSRRGAGLGLAICRGIVEAHGGRIWLSESAAPGAEFRFSLPVAAAPPA